MEKKYEFQRQARGAGGFAAAAVIIIIFGALVGYAMSSDDIGAGVSFFVICCFVAVILFLCGVSAVVAKRKTFDRLEQNGELEAAYDDYTAETSVKLDKKGRSVLGSKYLFALNAGRIYKYEDVLWVYITVHRSNGISISQMLYVCTADGKRFSLVNEKTGKKGEEKLIAYINAIVMHNPDCLVGYSFENQRTYRAAIAERKNK